MEGEQQQHHMHSCSSSSNKKFLKERSARDLIADKRRLVDVPYTASISDTINVLVANGVSAVPVAAPPGHWIGAGGSMILESDKATGAVRKHYIGMVAMLDVLIHIADEEAASDLDNLVSLPVSSIIGHCLEGLSLWTLIPDTSILDCMEVFSKGIHCALIPVDSHVKHVGVELADASPVYRMLSQMDVLRDLKAHGTELKDIMSCTVRELGAINENVYCVTQHMKAIEAIKCMRIASLSSVPIIEASDVAGEDHKITQALQSIDRDISSSLDYRRKPRDGVSFASAFYDAGTFAKSPFAGIPEALRPKPARLSNTQQQVYEDFVRFPWRKSVNPEFKCCYCWSSWFIWWFCQLWFLSRLWFKFWTANSSIYSTVQHSAEVSSATPFP